MFRKYGLPALAILGVVLAVFTVRASTHTAVERRVAERTTSTTAAANGSAGAATPVSGPAASPFESAIAGSGIVEASSDNIEVAAPLAGVVRAVYVKVGDDVNAGDRLFTVDDREALAALATAQANIVQAQAALDQMLAMPRQEDVPAAEAEVAAAAADAKNAARELNRVSQAYERNAASPDELARAQFNVESADARKAVTDARLAKLRAGAWKPEVAVAEAQLVAAQAEAAARAVRIERHTVRSPTAGRVLVLNVRSGEFISDSPPSGNAAVMVGAVNPLHVRVDIDENEAWRLIPGAPARVYVRGNPKLAAEATFVRIEPFVVPKRSLTGESAERVDTRVLQVIYAFDPAELPAYVGQQMDVFIESQADAN